MPAFDAAQFDAIKPGLIAELIAQDGLSQKKAEAAAEDYGRFLALVNDGRPTCPPSLADVAWHRHMEMPNYEADTVKMCGRALYHDKEAFGTVEFAAAWADTRARWFEAYGIELEIDPTKLAEESAESPAMCMEAAHANPAMCMEAARANPAMCMEAARANPAMCMEAARAHDAYPAKCMEAARANPAMCMEAARANPAMCMEAARANPAMCMEAARANPAMCMEQPAARA